MGPRLALETSLARALGGLSRVARRGGGTTIPGKVLWKIDPNAVDALAARASGRRSADVGDEREDDDDRDGGRDPWTRSPPCVEPRRRKSPLRNRVGARRLAQGGSGALRGRRRSASRSARPNATAGGRARQPLPRSARSLRRARDRRRALACRGRDDAAGDDVRGQRGRRCRGGHRGRKARCSSLRGRRPTTWPPAAAARGRLEVLRPLRRAVRVRRRVRRSPGRLQLSVMWPPPPRASTSPRATSSSAGYRRRGSTS